MPFSASGKCWKAGANFTLAALTEKVSRQLVAQLTDRLSMNGQRPAKQADHKPVEPVTKHNLFLGCVKFFGQVTPDKLVSFLNPGEKS